MKDLIGPLVIIVLGVLIAIVHLAVIVGLIWVAAIALKWVIS